MQRCVGVVYSPDDVVCNGDTVLGMYPDAVFTAALLGGNLKARDGQEDETDDVVLVCVCGVGKCAAAAVALDEFIPEQHCVGKDVHVRLRDHLEVFGGAVDDEAALLAELAALRGQDLDERVLRECRPRCAPVSGGRARCDALRGEIGHARVEIGRIWEILKLDFWLFREKK